MEKTKQEELINQIIAMKRLQKKYIDEVSLFYNSMKRVFTSSKQERLYMKELSDREISLGCRIRDKEDELKELQNLSN